jgi:hypothetical protein
MVSIKQIVLLGILTVALAHAVPPSSPAPDRLAEFAFLKSLKIKGSPTYTQMVHVEGGKMSRYPDWWYRSAMGAKEVAHLLKQRLTKKNGWDLTFPNMGQPFDAGQPIPRRDVLTGTWKQTRDPVRPQL